MVRDLLKIARTTKKHLANWDDNWVEKIKGCVRANQRLEDNKIYPYMVMFANYYANRSLANFRSYSPELVDWESYGLSFEYLRLSFKFGSHLSKSVSAVDISNALSLNLYGKIASRSDMVNFSNMHFLSGSQMRDRQSGKIKFFDVLNLLSIDDQDNIAQGYYSIMMKTDSFDDDWYSDLISEHVNACKNNKGNIPVFNMAAAVIPLDIILCELHQNISSGSQFYEFKNRIENIGYVNDGLVEELDVFSS